MSFSHNRTVHTKCVTKQLRHLFEAVSKLRAYFQRVIVARCERAFILVNGIS